MLLEGKVAIVTGAGRGVGKAVSIGFAQEGADVVVAARTKEQIEETANAIALLGRQALAVPTDIAVPEQVQKMAKMAFEKFGKVDILVNNGAYSGGIGPIWKVPFEEWRRMMDVNLLGQVLCVNAVLPQMIEQRSGKIINVASRGGLEAHHWAGPYCTSKAALIHYSRCLAAEVKGFGINVNAVSFEAYTQLLEEHRQGRFRWEEFSGPRTLEAPPSSLRRLPKENVPLVVFLASSISDHITGQFIEANSLSHLDILPK